MVGRHFRGLHGREDGRDNLVDRNRGSQANRTGAAGGAHERCAAAVGADLRFVRGGQRDVVAATGRNVTGVTDKSFDRVVDVVPGAGCRALESEATAATATVGVQSAAGRDRDSENLRLLLRGQRDCAR